MPRIAGVNIPDNKRIIIGLTYIYGIGNALARKIIHETGIDASVRGKDLTPEQIKILKEAIDNKHKVEGNLRRELMISVKRLKDISTWRGLRHIKGLPVRGQRTKTNNRTVRGNVRKTVGSGRKPPPTAK
jgi:small subunit ribosomal protein S13